MVINKEIRHTYQQNSDMLLILWFCGMEREGPPLVNAFDNGVFVM